MAQLTLTIDSDEFDYIARELNLEVDVTEDKVREIIAEHFDLKEMIKKSVRDMFISEGTTYGGKPYKHLSAEIKGMISDDVKPIIDTEVGNTL